ncbi:hypothetical protein BJ875DRAFT_479181 [Amylocarpus encephaloides]|uniref:Subtelomeric hrmA-associated cluster protein AFUB-079030/YDR124W-like helical bundle domain-containing protein n=1 Tax=Amylocarpus encephaloides TaxID=45428 RepID=A0A9P8CAQ6_9HELO|nr:hypothetical protein BJ875DRAFT_479181 [Amylocarpus encephaloides]
MVQNRAGPPWSQGELHPSRDGLPRNERPLMETPQRIDFGSISSKPALRIDVALKQFAHIPVAEFVLVARLDTGEERHFTSASLQPYRHKLLSERFMRNFTRYSRRVAARKKSSPAYGQDQTDSDFDPKSANEYRNPNAYGGGDSSSEATFPPCHRRHSRSEDSSGGRGRPGFKRKRSHFSNNDIQSPVPTQEFKILQIGNTEEVSEFYQVRFKDMQQSACKVMGKAFVKLVEPKKQTHHPYTKGDSCKPSWWPETSGEDCVRHKEPDHLLKPERIRLLVHILRMVVKPQEDQHSTVRKLGLTVQKLEEVTMEAMSNWFSDKEHTENALKKPYLREVFKVAKAEARFKNGEIDADTEIPIMNGERTALDSDMEDDCQREEDNEQAAETSHNPATPEPVTTTMFSQRQFEPNQPTSHARPLPTLIQTTTQQHIDNISPYTDSSYQSMGRFPPQSPMNGGFRRGSYAAPGFSPQQQTMYPGPWPGGMSNNLPNNLIGGGQIITAFTTSPPHSMISPAPFQQPAPQVSPQNMLPPLATPSYMVQQRYDSGHAPGPLRASSLHHTHGGFTDFNIQESPQYARNESDIKCEQHYRSS